MIARLRDLALIPAIIAIAVVGQIVNSGVPAQRQPLNVLQTMSEIAVLVLAETLVLVAGKMDLSLESTFGLAPGIAAWLTVAPGVTHGLGLVPGAWAVPITLAVGVLVGPFNGLLIVRFRLNGFIVTLGHAHRAARPPHRYLRRSDLLRSATVDALPEQRGLVRHAGVGVGITVRVRRRDRGPRVHHAAAARCTPSAAMSTPLEPPASGPTGCYGSR